MNKQFPDYSTFSTTDFILDKNFVQWVKNPGQEDLRFWENWMDKNPEKRRIIQDARALILHIRFETDHNTQENIDQTWNIISDKFDDQRNLNITSRFNARFFMRFAAAISIFALTATFIWLQIGKSSASSTYKTGNGEVSTIKLPDNSTVILNANSTLKIQINDGWNPGREAWITGEGFFRISKQKSKIGFTVHTSSLDVNVLGTEFNVSDRRKVSTVVLSEGKVRVKNTLGKIEELNMEPGELVAFSDTSRSLHLRTVNPENFSSWIHKKLVFEHTPIADVAQVLEDTYGLSVVISKPSLANKTFTATLPSDNLAVLLRALEESFNVSIRQLNKQLIITDQISQ